ncbi:MAG: TonB family protein [Deltaproteobacteria bacterium]
MSTKTFKHGDYGLFYFLLASVIAHFFAIWGFYAASSGSVARLLGMGGKPIIVDIIEPAKTPFISKNFYDHHDPPASLKPLSRPMEKQTDAQAILQKNIASTPSTQGTDKNIANDATQGQAIGTVKADSTGKPSEPVDSGLSGPGLMLPDERIAELAKRYEEAEPKGQSGKALQLNTSELKYQEYLLNIKQKIEFYWEYPLAAIKNNWQGRLRIDFSINKDGTIKDIRLVRSSSYPGLDDAAITALRLSSPFPPLPESFGVEDISIHGSFEYVIYR